MATFFSKVKQFPDVPEDEAITLDPYLEAAEGATTIFGKYSKSHDVSYIFFKLAN